MKIAILLLLMGCIIRVQAQAVADRKNFCLRNRTEVIAVESPEDLAVSKIDSPEFIE